jgi:plasmid stabilization system protein ParE
MSWILQIRSAAEKDIAEARDWYETQHSGLGDEFRTSIKQAMARLVTSPDLSPPYYGAFYRILTERFPFKIFYRINGRKVVVFRVLHNLRDHIHLLPNR